MKQAIFEAICFVIAGVIISLVVSTVVVDLKLEQHRISSPTMPVSQPPRSDYEQ